MLFKSDLLRPHIHHIFGNDHIIEADAAGVQGVVPFMLVAVQETKHHDGHPAVNENGIRQQIQPGLCRRADFPEHRYRENVLAYTDDLPNLDGQNFIQHVGIKRNQIVNVSAEHKKCGQQQEVRLYQIDHAVQYDDIMFRDPFPEHFRYVAVGYVKMLWKGITEHNIIVLDGMINLVQPYFLLLSTFFVFCTYIYNLVPFYTNVLYEVLPIQVWQIIGVGQYIFPVAVLWKIRASAKSWLYLLAYPIFIYSWVPIVMLGFLHRNEHEWNHTLHTRGISFDDVIIPEDVVNVGPKQVAFKKQ